MTSRPSESNTNQSSRRSFMKTASLSVASGALLTAASPVHAAGTDTLRVGLIGSGGRGSGAAKQALMADQNVKLVAIADMFPERVASCLRSLTADSEIASKIDVPKERQFLGFDAYQQLLASDVDVVLLTTPPHFRPIHLKAAIEAGKHVFAEKPVAVDGPGVRSVLESCAQAKQKNLSVVSGLCLRYDAGFQETIERIHDGQIGDVHTLFADDYRGSIWVKDRQPDWTDMHWQMHNWYYFTWLSGDFNVEQHVHYLDVSAWVMNKYPVKAIGMGGRQVRTGEMYGNIYDHHGVVYEYEDGSRVVSNCRQQSGCKNSMRAFAMGSAGSALISEKGLEIQGKQNWSFQGPAKNMYQVEHDRLFESIRSAKPRNDGDYMAYSTLMAIQGRMATYTGQEVTWDQALHSKQDLSPAAYQWGDAPEVTVAMPGVTKVI